MLLAAENQLEAAGGLEHPETPFVTINMTLDVENQNNVIVEGFQVSIA